MLEECAIRETLEETGVIIADVTFLAITNNVFEARKEHTSDHASHAVSRKAKQRFCVL